MKILALAQQPEAMTDAVFRTLVVLAACGSVSVLKLAGIRGKKVDTIQQHVNQLTLLGYVEREGANILCTRARDLLSSHVSNNTAEGGGNLRSDLLPKGVDTKIDSRERVVGDRKDVASKLSEMESAFRLLPSRVLVTKAYSLAMDTNLPLAEYTSLVLVGHYLACYEKRYVRKFAGGRASLKELRDGIVLLVQRIDDTREVYLAIEAVFSKEMGWVTNQLSLLLNRDAYTKWVIPVVTVMEEKRKSRGEQAEWRTGRQASGSRKVEL